MSSATTRQAARERIERLALAGLDDETLRMECVAVLRRAVGFDAWSWATSDPTSLVAVSALAEHPLQSAMPALLAAEENQTEPTRRAALAASADPLSVLSSVTAGDLARNERWRNHLAPYGIGDELRAVFADATGCWGYLDLYRMGARPHFSEDDADLVRKSLRVLTSSLRVAHVPEPSPSRSNVHRQPAVLLLDEQFRIVARTGPAEQWLGVLRWSKTEPMPCAVLAAAARALAVPGDDVSSARQRDCQGSWSVVRAARLDSGGLAVTLDYATPAEILAFSERAWGLSTREREVVRLLYAGLDTHAIATTLGISERTVHDHVKNIFVKTGHSSRRDLLASLHLHGPVTSRS